MATRPSGIGGVFPLLFVVGAFAFVARGYGSVLVVVVLLGFALVIRRFAKQVRTTVTEFPQQAAELFRQLPPEVRAELEKQHRPEPGVHVEVEGPLGHAVARMAGFPAPEPAPGEVERPSSWTVTPEGTTAVEPEPAVVPAAQPETRFGVLAPDVLTGDEDTPPGAVAEGWYRTADGSRERWHNGAAWTAHERPPGGY